MNPDAPVALDSQTVIDILFADLTSAQRTNVFLRAQVVTLTSQLAAVRAELDQARRDTTP